MMIVKRRCTGWRAGCVAGSLIILFVAANPAAGGIISDRSAFVGDFTVIDFETLADGTPLILEEGAIFGMHPEEYSALGVTITSSGNVFGNDRPFISNDRSAAFDRAQELAGSLHNDVSSGSKSEGFLRFDFSPSVDAIGVTSLVRSDGSPVILELFDVSGNLLDRVVFQGDLIDGVVLGTDFGNEFDVSYGFLGYSSPNARIGYAILSEDIASFDDLHFGTIPDTSTLYLLSLGMLLILLVRKKGFVFRRGNTALVFLVVLLAAPASLRAETVTGTVTGYVMTTEHPICGDNGPPGCVQQSLQQVPLHGVRVCESGMSCNTFTDEDGIYTLTVADGVPVDIEADLDGQWTKVGTFEIIDNLPVFTVTPPLVVTFNPNAPPPNPIDFVFNANPNAVLEFPTAEANIFYHTMLVREFYLQRHTSFTGLNVKIASARNATACDRALFTPSLLRMSFPESGFGCIAKADRSIVAHEYGHVIHNALGLVDTNTDEAFREGFADTVALLVYDFPDLFLGHDGQDSKKSYDFAADPSLRIVDPCLTGQCPAPPNSTEPDPNCCGSILAGAWWDIKLNMQAKYGAAGAPDCPINPALNGTDAQGHYQFLISNGIAVNIEADLDGPAIDVPGGSSLSSTKGAEL